MTRKPVDTDSADFHRFIFNPRRNLCKRFCKFCEFLLDKIKRWNTVWQMKHHTLKLFAIVGCLAIVGIAGCKKQDPSTKVLPGRHMTESQALSRATQELPPGPAQSVYHVTFTNGIWEVTSISNNIQHVVTIRDADGKLEHVK